MKSLPNGKLAAFLQLRPLARLLLVQAFVLGTAVRLALWVLPFRLVYRWLSPSAKTFKGKPRLHKGDPLTLDEAVKLIRKGLAFVPCKTCLVSALTAQLLLPRYGHPTELHIGVAKDKADNLIAHAWIENEGEILIGGQQSRDYTLLSTWRSM